jgi:hypothetical protein
LVGFLEINNQKQELPVAAMFVNGSGQNEQLFYRGPAIDASYQVSVHLAKWLNHISQYLLLELKFRVFPRTVFPGNYHWEFPPLVFPGQPWL